MSERPQDSSQEGGCDARGRYRARLVILAVTVLLLGGMVYMCLNKTEGRLVYALDDAYIHLGMARTLAEDHIIGINRNSPGAASSAPLWTILTAGFAAVFGAGEWLPLGMNVAAALVLVMVLGKVLREELCDWRAEVLVLLGIVLVMPLVPLVMTGMEHVAHTLFVVLLCTAALRGRSVLAVLLLSGIATGLRYETGFVIAGLAPVMVYERKWGQMIAAAAGAAAAAGSVGLVQMARGEDFLANSIMVKVIHVTSGTALGRIDNMMNNFREAPLLLTLGVMAAVLSFGPEIRKAGGRAGALSARLSAVFLAAAPLHCFFARVGWFERYQAYLVVLGMTAVAYPVFALLARAKETGGRGVSWRYAAIAGGVVIFGVLMPGKEAINEYRTTPLACRNIYQQQYQMARFLQRYYNEATVVACDIGYIGFLSEAKIVDIKGLATHEVAVARRAGKNDAKYYSELAARDGADIAVSYNYDYLPNEEWKLAGSWEISQNIVCAHEMVEFRAVDTAQFNRLAANLREFEGELPAGIKVAYE